MTGVLTRKVNQSPDLIISLLIPGVVVIIELTHLVFFLLL